MPVLSGVEERLAPLKAWLFPRRVLLLLEDHAITSLAVEGSRVIWCEQVPLPAGLCSLGEPIQVDSLGDLLGDLLVERGFVGARVEAVLPAAACQCRLVRWPDGRWPDDPLRLLALHEATLKLQAPLSYLDLLLVPLELPQPTTLSVAVPHQLLERWIEVFSLAGASLEQLEAAQLCLCRALLAVPGLGCDVGTTVLLQREADGANLMILEAGIPAYARSLPGADQEELLAQQLQRVLQFWRQHHPLTETPLLICHGSSLPPGERLEQLAAAVGCNLRLLDPLAEGWLQVEPAPEGQQRPPGSVLLPLWGLLAAHGLAGGAR
jgi:hypothetical protein